MKMLLMWMGGLALLLASPESVVVPEIPYPENTVGGAVVVAEYHRAAPSEAEVRILRGEDPWSSLARETLAFWRLGSDPIRIPVVISFRSPFLRNVESPAHQLKEPDSDVGELAYPRGIVEPDYPPNMNAFGNVVLRLEIDEEGRVRQSEVMRSLGALTEACRAAVSRWEFYPARSESGDPVSSEACAVCVFRLPVLSPGSP